MPTPLRSPLRSLTLRAALASSALAPVAIIAPLSSMMTPHIAAAQAATFDHSAFDALLKAHVVDGMVDYGAFKSSAAFTSYLAALTKQDPALLPRNEQLAFWINAYNAYTIQLITSHGETKSIRNINKTLGLKLKGPWGEPLAGVGGKMYTLDDIEHVIIRPTYKEPRIHFALVCAAMGCPPLRSEAYTGARLEAQLDDQGARFITKSPAKNRVDVANNTFYHSMIFGYYKADFGGSLPASGKFAAKWLPTGSPERALLEGGKFKAVETEYDWSLNSQANARRMAPK
jgi:hypothetical protein